MFKKLFTGFFTLALATAGVSYLVSSNANAIDEPIVIDNVLSLCNAVTENGFWFDDSGTCDAYSSDQISALIDRRIYVRGNWILKDLDLTFTISNSPFYISSGSLTIEGGHYTSPSCVIWIQYDEGIYDPMTSVVINSGVFEASVETTYSADSPSPVCLITRENVTPEESQAIIAGYLPAGKKFVDIAPRLRMRSKAKAASDETVSESAIEADSGYAHVDKDGSNRTEVKYLKTTLVEVVGEPIPEPEDEPEEPVEPGMGSVEEPEETPETSSLPKAPNTGSAK